MKIHTVDQRSLDWMQLHVGKVSASEFSNLVTPLMKERDGDTPATYLHKKVAEVFRDKPLCTMSSATGSWQMEQGIILEDEVLPWYELRYDCDVQRVGFCEHENGLAGCSPDGLLGADGGLEIKAPEPHTHVKYLMGGTVPKEYIPQVYFSLYVTGRAWWRFVSYRRGFPALVVKVETDKNIMYEIDAIVRRFQAKMHAALERLRSLQ